MADTGASRRALLRAGGTAAWTAPLIVAASAAPALAVSGSDVLSFDPGDSSVLDDAYYAFRFVGFTIAPGSAVDAGDLSMTVTFSEPQFFKLPAVPAGWLSPGAGPVDSVVYIYAGPAAAGQTISVEDGQYFDADSQQGTFTLVMSAPGQTSASFQASTPVPQEDRDGPSRARVTQPDRRSQ